MNNKLEEKVKYLLPVIEFNKSIITKGEGTHIYDKDGTCYLDINSGQFCSILGHSNPKIAEEISKSLYKIQHTNTSMLTDNVLYTAEKLNRISGEMDASSIILSTGGEGIEFCLRYAKHIKGKNGVICFNKGYHGLTLGAQSITYAGQYALPYVPLTYNVSIPDTFSNEDTIKKCIDEFKKVLISHRNEIAVAIFEPIVSVGGMIIPPEKYFQEIRRLCDEYDILLAFDECQTGFARTGTWFYHQQIRCTPDIVVCAKGIGLGYPVSAVMFKRNLVPKDGFKMAHYSSHQNDAFQCEIINIGIDYIEKNKIMDSIKEKGEYFLKGLIDLSKECTVITKPRGKGLMLGVDIELENVHNYRPIYKKIHNEAQKRGLIIQGTNGGKTLRFLPSYLIDYSEIDLCIAILKEICMELN
ncbi:aspartate aminotransferase family protein [Clostridium tetani]|uniref:class-III pyridoxal-phosphate-dependent aminotransferase n=1 Tax=Clostridium tetani TaxID=1513 RepID=UPI00100C2B79|nr:aspartate aminotransferase family protein [Clostridium tetani]